MIYKPGFREFKKQIRHNNNFYNLRSIYDKNTFDFDRAIRDFKKQHQKIDFDAEINSIKLYDGLNDLYDTNLFD